ncbi:MAG TPA: acyl-CoA dehydrogenase family protein, partial [Acidimicrobiia bacterium]|nr:acyl-CoA dehydrogenase family protein [Acidimicrobiia bacterium]
MTAFREELVAWLTQHVTPDVSQGGHRPVTADNLPMMRDWNRQLADAGWAAPAWPARHGGRDADIDEQLAYLEEMARADAPGPINSIGVSNIAPAIMAYGTADQQERFLRPLLRGDEIWSQGMSEPDAGSDLASLRTAAVRDGDDFVLNGQKVWTTFGPWADWIFVLARTDGKDRYGGISFILCKLDTPGITVRPLRQITGESEFGEVFFEDARVPRENLVGQVGEGWRIAMTVLGYERGVGSLANSARYGRDL